MRKDVSAKERGRRSKTFADAVEQCLDESVDVEHPRILYRVRTSATYPNVIC